MISIVFTSRDKLPFFSEVKKEIVMSISQIYYGLLMFETDAILNRVASITFF